jgi:hypothetical protein
MDQRKLYTTVGQGFRNTVKMALVSRLYPVVLTDSPIGLSAPAVVDFSLDEIPNHDDYLGLSAPSIADIRLELNELGPQTEMPLSVSGPVISAFELDTVLITHNTQTPESGVTLGAPAITQFTLTMVLVNINEQPPETGVTLSAPNITEVTLT